MNNPNSGLHVHVGAFLDICGNHTCNVHTVHALNLWMASHGLWNPILA